MQPLTFIALCAVAALTSLAARASSVEELGWLAGDWLGRTDDTFIQEQWSQPEGDSMIGMFRLLVADEPRFYEFMTITGESGRPVLRIKHFDPDLIGWESKDESVVFELVESSATRAVFERPGPERLIFERTGHRLLIVLDKPAEDSRSEFRFERQ